MVPAGGESVETARQFWDFYLCKFFLPLCALNVNMKRCCARPAALFCGGGCALEVSAVWRTGAETINRLDDDRLVCWKEHI